MIHRDLHLDNLFFDGDRPVLTDWQRVSWGPVALDVAHQLTELPLVEDRRSIEVPAREAFGDDLALALVWYLIGGIDWVVYGSHEGAHPRKLAVMDDMLGSGKLFAAALDWDAGRALQRLG